MSRDSEIESSGRRRFSDPHLADEFAKRLDFWKSRADESQKTLIVSKKTKESKTPREEEKILEKPSRGGDSFSVGTIGRFKSAKLKEHNESLTDQQVAKERRKISTSVSGPRSISTSPRPSLASLIATFSKKTTSSAEEKADSSESKSTCSSIDSAKPEPQSKRPRSLGEELKDSTELVSSGSDKDVTSAISGPSMLKSLRKTLSRHRKSSFLADCKPLDESTASATSEKIKLTSEEHRQAIKTELLMYGLGTCEFCLISSSTEENYLNDLKLLVEKFVHPLKRSPQHGVSQLEATAMFSNVEIIACFHEKFLVELKSSPEPGDVFLRFADFLKMYTQYTRSYDKTIEAFHSLRSNSRFKTFLESRRKDGACAGREITAFLILPVQRVPRYKMLLSQLLKYTSREDPAFENLQAALIKVELVASHINEAQRLYESATKLLEIQHNSSVDPDDVQIVKPGRLLIRKTPVLSSSHGCPGERSAKELTERRFSGVLYKQRVLFLFNDCIVVTRQDFSLTCFMYLGGVMVSKADFQDVPVFQISTAKERVRFACISKEERDDWMEIILKSKAEVKKHREMRWTLKKKSGADSEEKKREGYATLQRLKRIKDQAQASIHAFDEKTALPTEESVSGPTVGSEQLVVPDSALIQRLPLPSKKDEPALAYDADLAGKATTLKDIVLRRKQRMKISDIDFSKAP